MRFETGDKAYVIHNRCVCECTVGDQCFDPPTLMDKRYVTVNDGNSFVLS